LTALKTDRNRRSTRVAGSTVAAGAGEDTLGAPGRDVVRLGFGGMQKS
jgi:hypothetical protein